MITNTQQSGQRFKLPATIGERVEFNAQGSAFYVKKLRAGLYFLSGKENTTRSRFGTSAEIREDIEHVQQTGNLPKSAGDWH